MSYKAIIFDLDGTIVNTIDDIGYFCNLTLDKFGYKTREISEYKNFVGWGIKATIVKALAPIVVDDNELSDMNQYFVEHYNSEPVKYSKPYDGIIHLMENFDGHIAVCTNKTESVAIQVVNKLFGDLVVDIAGVTSITPSKPDPTTCNNLINKSGLSKEEILYVGDSIVDIQTAQNAGLKVAAVTWGYFDKAKLLTANPDFVCHTADDIKKIVS